MIDWMTLRTKMDFMTKGDLLDKVQHFIGRMDVFDGAGELVRTKLVMDIDRLRSDSTGLFWQIQHSGKDIYLVIGASPASVELGNNLFGSSDVEHCAKVLLSAAEKILGIPLPSIINWECRRLDITHNYLMDDHSQVKQALRELRNGDGIRQKASVPKGDSVYYGEGSDLIAGKIYDKGSQVKHLAKRYHAKGIEQPYDVWEMDIIDRLLRMELMLRRRWFDRLQNKLTIDDFTDIEKYKAYKHTTPAWLELTSEQLDKLHNDYFSQFIGNIEVTDMTTLLKQLYLVAPSAGRARAAHNTWALIKAIGYEQTRESMSLGTFNNHRSWLLKAGLSHADLQTSNVLPFRRKTVFISQPVLSWSDVLRQVA
jgi:II/X family phage/plasmid replication protein